MQKLIKLSFKDTSGSALILAVVFSAVFLIVGTGTMKLISRGNQLHTREVKVMRSYWANEGALRVAMRYLTRAPHPAETISNLNASGFLDINGYTPEILIDRTSPPESNPAFGVTISTQVENLSHTTSISQVSFNDFSRYTYFQQTSAELEGVWVSQVIDGNYHSNEDLWLHKSMLDVVHVTGECTCAGTFNGSSLYPDEYGRGIKVVDRYGTLYPKDKTWFKRRLPNYRSVSPIPTDNIAPASDAFDNGWTIEENTSGTYDAYFVKMKSTGVAEIFGLEGSNNWQSLETVSLTHSFLSNYDGIIKSDLPIHVGGTLNGQLTVVSNQIHIAGHVLYDGITPGQIPPTDLKNILGIVSSENVNIPKDFSMYASIYDEEFKPFSWWESWSGGQDNLYLYGSFISKNGDIVPYPSVDSWPKTTRERYVKLVGSNLVYVGKGTYLGGSGKFWGFIMDAKADPRHIQNIAAPPGFPDVREIDHEVLDYHADEFTDGIVMKYPLNVGTWENYME